MENGVGMENGERKLENGVGKKVLVFLWAAIVVFAICVGIGVRMFFNVMDKATDNGVALTVNEEIDITPTIISEMREIGEWEFLAINDEELQDTIRKGVFSDDELVRIYYGTVRLGIDFSECDESWIRRDGDSISIKLPQVKLLDEDFLDETRTRSFIETGSWSNADRKAMAERAKVAMKKRCLTKQNIALAQKNADEQMRKFVATVTQR